MNTRRNYSFKKAANLITGIIPSSLSDMAVYQNEAIQAGIRNKRDIDGKAFVALKQSTMEIRNKRGQGFTPLDRMKGERQKKLRNTKVHKATKRKLVSKVEMLTSYGVYHNQEGGFKIENRFMKKEKQVPQRKWFGITKDMKKGGRRYENYIRMALRKIDLSFKK